VIRVSVDAIVLCETMELTIDRIGLGAQLLSELALVDEVQVVRDGVVGLAENLDASALEVVAGSEAARRTAAESDAGGADGCDSLQGMDDGGFDGTGGGAREVESELDLPAVFGCELCKDDETCDFTLLGRCVVVLPVRHVLPGVHVCQVNLLALGLPAVQPVGDTLVDLRLQVIREVLSKLDVMNLDALLFCMADLALHLRILETLDVVGIKALFGSNGECAPVKFCCKHFLCCTTAKQPQRLDLALLLDVTKVCRHCLGVLGIVAERVTNGHGKALVLHETNSRASVWVSPAFEMLDGWILVFLLGWVLLLSLFWCACE
jgi:hypothetical protein